MTIEKWAIILVGIVIATLLGIAIAGAENRSEYAIRSEGGHEASSPGIAEDEGVVIDFDAARRGEFRTPSPKPGGAGGTAGGASASGAQAGGDGPVATAYDRVEVERGDTLSSIARRVYGDARLYGVLLEANPQVDPRKLRAGDLILAPRREARETQRRSTAERRRETETEAEARRHTVRARETLAGLAKRYYRDEGRWREILAANGSVLSSPRSLRPGMVLVIP